MRWPTPSVGLLDRVGRGLWVRDPKPSPYKTFLAMVDNSPVVYESVVDGGWDQHALCCKRLEAQDNQ